MDMLPAWFWIPTIIILWSVCGGMFIAEVFRANPDPNPEYSRLDRLGGLNTRG